MSHNSSFDARSILVIGLMFFFSVVAYGLLPGSAHASSPKTPEVVFLARNNAEQLKASLKSFSPIPVNFNAENKDFYYSWHNVSGHTIKIVADSDAEAFSIIAPGEFNNLQLPLGPQKFRIEIEVLDQGKGQWYPITTFETNYHTVRRFKPVPKGWRSFEPPHRTHKPQVLSEAQKIEPPTPSESPTPVATPTPTPSGIENVTKPAPTPTPEEKEVERRLIAMN